MPLAIFDLDNTLLAGDSDYLWGRFLSAQGITDGDAYERENARFLHDYEAGVLDIQAFLRFSLRPLSEQPRERMEALRERFTQEIIPPIIPAAARRLVEQHRARGDQLLIITATNAFVTAPIAACFGITELIATEPEEIGGRFTGKVAGVPAFREGKVQRLETWLATRDLSLAGSSFYSDSHNDLPLLERVDRPVAVDPDPRLRDFARARGWPVMTLRGTAPDTLT